VGNNYHEAFNLDPMLRPIDYYQNDFQDNYDGTVTDYATGLMWVKNPKNSFNENIVSHVFALSLKQFAGYWDWRLPTIPEFISILEPARQANGLHISPIFEDPTWVYLSADFHISFIPDGSKSFGVVWDCCFKDYRISGGIGVGSIFAVRSIDTSDWKLNVNDPWTPD
jgi:hypothetical protein